MNRACKYRRISDDEEGLELGVARQDQDLNEFAAREKLQVVADRVDNDLGASTRSKKPRPAFLQMLDEARAGAYDVIIAYTSSRLTRHPRENEDLIELAERHGVRFQFIRSPSFDLNTADGRMVARYLAANDAAEAERTAERVARKRKATAEQGLASGGSRPFGYRAPNGPLEPAEAKLILAAANSILNGGVISHLVDEWNASGLTSARGGTWARNSLLSVLKSPRVAGVAFYQGQPLRESDGSYKRAQWPAVMDVDTWEALCAKLSANAGGRTSWRSYLLSGTVRCSCGALMYGGARKGKPHVYRCQKEKGGCGQRSVAGASLDRLIEKWVDRKLEGLTTVLLAGPEWQGEEALALAQRQKQEFLDAYKDGLMPGSVAFPEIAQREEDIGRLTRERAAARKSQLPPSDARTTWRDGDEIVRREIVKRLLAAVIVGPAPLGKGSGRHFDATRIEPVER